MVDMKQPITKNKINIKIRYDLQDKIIFKSHAVCNLLQITSSLGESSMYSVYQIREIYKMCRAVGPQD